MSVQLKSAHLDLGIVTDNGDSMSHFYGTILGFPEIQELPLPGIGRLKKYAVGESIIKIMILNESPKIAANKAGIRGAIGYRYCAVHVNNLDDIIRTCKLAGCQISSDIQVLRPGCRIAIVEDPDDNSVEFFEE